jgi:hypothetical protein
MRYLAGLRVDGRATAGVAVNSKMESMSSIVGLALPVPLVYTRTPDREVHHELEHKV